jgi:hypothetical protein
MAKTDKDDAAAATETLGGVVGGDLRKEPSGLVMDPPREQMVMDPDTEATVRSMVNGGEDFQIPIPIRRAWSNCAVLLKRIGSEPRLRPDVLAVLIEMAGGGR